jgi:MYXO-CTERM domain-containing protein
MHMAKTALGVVAVAAFSGNALGAVTVLGDAFTLNVSSSLGSASWIVPAASLVPIAADQQRFEVLTGAGFDLTSGPNTIARLNSMRITFRGDAGSPAGVPQISISFNILAGAADTTIDIVSGTASFAGIFGPRGNSSLSMGAADTNANGGFTAGGFGGLFQRTTTNVGIFATHTAGPAVPGSSAGNLLNTVVPGVVNSLQTRINYTVSAGDNSNGTSVFNVPGPGAAALLGLAGLVAGRRRR